MLRRRACLLLLSLVLSLAVTAQAQTPFPKPTGLVNDFASLLQPNERGVLERYLLAFRDSTGIEIAIAIFPSLPPGQSLEGYTQQLAAKWGVGQEGDDSGLLWALYIQDRRSRFEVGYGLEAEFTDAESAEVFERYAKPGFAQGNYYQGLQQGITAITRKLSTGSFPGRTVQEDGPDRLTGLIMVGVFFLILFLLARGSRGGGRGGRGGGGGGGFIWWGGGYGSGFGGGSSFGGGGGGFGGFGGGGFGGGGSSGSW